MLARCTHCESTFVTTEFGRQRCPKCRAEIVVEDPRPGASNPYSSPTEPVVEPPAEPITPELTPWERRAELGFGRALGQTIAEVLSKPGQFFTKLRYETDDGAIFYYLIVAVVPALLSEVFTWVTTDPAATKADVAMIMDNLGQMMTPELKSLIDASQKRAEQAATVQGLVLSLIETPVFWLLGLFISAGISHLVLAMLGRAKGGWSASFKVFVYAFTPVLLMVIPSCFVETIALTWATCLQILGLSKAHRISFAMASVGVIGFHVVATTCVLAVGALAWSVVMGGHALS